ncbi:MAG: ATP-binding protein [Acidobacteriota bacterium]
MTSIRGRLIRRLLAWFALPLLCGELGVFLMMRHALVEQFDDALRAKALAIATVTRVEDGLIKVSSADRFMREFDGPDEKRRDESARDESNGGDALIASAFFQMWEDGKTVQRSESLGSATLAYPASAYGFWDTALPSRHQGRAMTFAFSPWTPRGQPPAVQLLLVVASGRGELDRTLETLAGLLAACGLVLLAAASLGVPRVLRRELGPLDAITEQAVEIDASTLASRFGVDGLPSELLPIATRLNDLLSRLERSFERERQFSADLAHELRTPIAELRSVAELALKWPESRDPRTDRDALQIAIQMEGIVTGLLQLLRSEPGPNAVSRELVVLEPLLQGVWGPLADRAQARDLRIMWRLPVGAVMHADPALLRSVVSNLLENAVEYAPEHSAVEVTACVEATGFVVRVTNDAVDFSEDDLPRLFDRLWRRDPARSTSGHYGLGLSIARAFAHAMGGELTATLDPRSRLALTLSGLGPEAH